MEVTTWGQYQEFVSELAKRNGERLSESDSLFLAISGLTGELGEVAEHVKKYMFHDRPMNVDELVLEMGDLLWYFVHLCNRFNISIEEVRDRNVEKLLARHGSTKFSSEYYDQ